MSHTQQNTITDLLYQSNGLSIAAFIQLLTDKFPGQVTFSSSFSYEDQVITHEILNNQLPVKIFTLDTGRLFAETYSVWNSTNEKYNTRIKAYYPQANTLQEFVEAKGPNSFYESVDNRKQCCFIRKVEPLKRALAGNAVWITGLRAERQTEPTCPLLNGMRLTR
jgi:phosphoadenosine phosphosulfate reductase